MSNLPGPRQGNKKDNVTMLFSESSSSCVQIWLLDPAAPTPQGILSRQ